MPRRDRPPHRLFRVRVVVECPDRGPRNPLQGVSIRGATFTPNGGRPIDLGPVLGATFTPDALALAPEPDDAANQ